MEKSVAFLDLLAFSNHLTECTKDALIVFSNYRTILETKIIDGVTHPSPSYSEESLKELARRRLIDSFDYLLPFSDSIFISASDPNLFIKQIGTFVLECFTFTADHYRNPEDKRNPYKVKIRQIGINQQGRVETKEVEENWYPTLFRGGICWGEAYPIDLISIVDKKPQTIKNLTGKAVVKAVGLETKIKGPRIIFETDYFNLLDDETKKCVQQTELKDFYEILWPSFYYIPSNGEGELRKFTHLFTPAVNFWNAFNHTPYSEHYFKFLELIVSSTIKTFENIGLTEKCIGYLRGQIRNHGLELKIPELLKSYCR